MPSSPNRLNTLLEPSSRLLYAMVLLRFGMGLYFCIMGYTHWHNPMLVQDLTSHWIDWTQANPLFWVADLFHALIIPNAWFFAPLQAGVEILAGLSILLGIYHQWGIQTASGWIAMHLLLCSHLPMSSHHSGLLLTQLGLCVVLWLADAGRWVGVDTYLLMWRERRMAEPVLPLDMPQPSAI